MVLGCGFLYKKNVLQTNQMGTTSVCWESKIIFEGVHQDNELKIVLSRGLQMDICSLQLTLALFYYDMNNIF